MGRAGSLGAPEPLGLREHPVGVDLVEERLLKGSARWAGVGPALRVAALGCDTGAEAPLLGGERGHDAAMRSSGIGGVT